MKIHKGFSLQIWWPIKFVFFRSDWISILHCYCVTVVLICFKIETSFIISFGLQQTMSIDLIATAVSDQLPFKLPQLEFQSMSEASDWYCLHLLFYSWVDFLCYFYYFHVSVVCFKQIDGKLLYIFQSVRDRSV